MTHIPLTPRRSACLLSLLAITACPVLSDAELLLRTPQAPASIVGGDLESGWPGVGALVFQYPGYGYQGSFCTGVLVAPSWVLTAAHCLRDHDNVRLLPTIALFYVGDNAVPLDQGGFPAGDYYQVDTFVPHPFFDEGTAANDIALLHLSEPANAVQPYAPSTLALDTSHEGQAAFYVGYGATDGLSGSGKGVKRSASIAISDVDSMTYSNTYNGTAICFGDSGGPGFLSLQDVWHVVGVTSGLVGQGGDPCHGISYHTRVDRFADWISGHVDGPAPSCLDDGELCFCAQACQAGVCDNSVCRTLTCAQLRACSAACGSAAACQYDCYVNATDDARVLFNRIFQCSATYCAGLSGDALIQCQDGQCAPLVVNCAPPPPPDCVLTGGDCPVGEACYPRLSGGTDCYSSAGTAGAQPVILTPTALCLAPTVWSACASVTTALALICASRPPTAPTVKPASCRSSPTSTTSAPVSASTGTTTAGVRWWTATTTPSTSTPPLPRSAATDATTTAMSSATKVVATTRVRARMVRWWGSMVQRRVSMVQQGGWMVVSMERESWDLAPRCWVVAAQEQAGAAAQCGSAR